MPEDVNTDLDWLTEEMVSSYDVEPRTRRIGETFLPDRSTIVEILEQLRHLLFPGFFGHKRLTKQNVRYHVGSRLVRVAQDLSEQITHCICSDRECEECDSPEVCRGRADEIARDFLSRLPTMRSALALDAQAAYDGDPAARSIDEVIYCYPGFYAVTVYRIAHELLDLGVPLMPRIMSEHAHSATGTDIHPGASIGRSVFVDHATGVIIGETTEIGNNVKIYQGVTLGALSFPKDGRGRAIKGLKRHPTIEDNVTIYANATILGGETVIGRGATINGNIFVTQSVSAETTVGAERPELKVKSKTS
ncbi:MAG: serine acetyltransferase [Planctomycetes bacterium]|jgi:serine O-acetyltransferase|nr:serine acetyltransferase [Phycisphaerae bacterium]NBB95114.1 serine acetyltransferase [Planctomycetota bacterium]